MAGRKLDLDSSAAEERDMEGRDEDEEDGWATPGKSETDDSEGDPTFDVIELTSSKLSSMSLRKSRSRASEEVGLSQLNDKEKKCFDTVEKMIKGGDLDKLKVEDCKSYLRKYGLRLTGNKNVLQARIEEHLQVMEGGGEKKYPISSFVLNCKGDACMGDVVMFEQNVYDMFSIASRSATGPPCGTRTVAGRIVKESYGAAKQQHTFTVEVLWSKGEKPLPPLHPLLIKGRNIYRLKTMRQRWNDEEERKRILQEKHRRGCIARCSRKTRIQEKEMREVTRGKRHQALMSEKPIAAGAQNTRHQTLVSEKPIAAGSQNTGHQARASERPIAAGAHNTRHQACVPEKPIAFGAQNPWHQTLVSEKPIAAGAQNTGHRARVTEMPIAAGAQSTRHQACLPEKPIAVGAQNPWHEALVSENPMHQAPVSQKPIATEGHRNAIHHQNPEKCSDRTQCKQNGSSAQVMLPQASVTALPYLGVNHENDLALRNLHSTSRLNLPPKGKRSHPDGSAERRPLRNLNSSPTLASPPLGNRVHSNHQDDTFYDGPRRNSKSSSTLGSPQHRYQLHGSHRDGFADGRRPLTDLGSSSILGVPPLGHRIHSNHQDHGFSHDWPRRSCNSSSGVGSQLHGHHHPVRRQPCHWYLQGRCWYGDDCRYLH